MRTFIDRILQGGRIGFAFAVTSAVMLGLTPVFGKQAILAGMDPLTTVAMRTIGASAMLFLALVFFRRKYFYIYPLGLAGCALAGLLNGLGSVCFYVGLGRIDASLGQFLFTLYPVFVAGLTYLDGQRTSLLTFWRLLISVLGVFLLTQKNGGGTVDLTGVFFMLAAALLYAVHIPINQRVLYEVPAPTVTFYTLLAMVLVVVPLKFAGSGLEFTTPAAALRPILLLTIVTFVSRLALFAGVKAIGGVQTSLIGLLELLVTVVLARLLLHESLTLLQWLGALLIVMTLMMAAIDPIATARHSRGWLHWLRPPMPSTNPGPSALPASDDEIDG